MKSSEPHELSAGAARGTDPERPLRPLTERLLAALPGAPIVWVAIWALVPSANAAANLLFDTARTSAVWEQSDALIIVNYVALSVGVVVTLWGARRIARRLEALRGSTAEVFVGDLREHFREVNSVRGPVALAVAASLALGGAALVREGWGPALLRGATWFVLGIAVWTFVWTYASLQLGLNRLGRTPFRPESRSLESACSSVHSAVSPSWGFGCSWCGSFPCC